MVLDDVEDEEDVEWGGREEDAEGREEEDKFLEFAAKNSFLIDTIIDSILRRASLAGSDTGFNISFTVARITPFCTDISFMKMWRGGIPVATISVSYGGCHAGHESRIDL